MPPPEKLGGGVRDGSQHRLDLGFDRYGTGVEESLGRDVTVCLLVVDDLPRHPERLKLREIPTEGLRDERGPTTMRAPPAAARADDNLGVQGSGHRCDCPELRIDLAREEASNARRVLVYFTRELRLLAASRLAGLPPFWLG
jgi:hypothetical protein